MSSVLGENMYTEGETERFSKDHYDVQAYIVVPG